MKKVLVAFFSATGITEELAEGIAAIANADIFEIEPMEDYTSADLNWTDKQSRTTIEMNDPSSRPQIKEMVDNMDEYNTVFVGFPIWWYTAPRIINTFLESYDLEGKTIVPFATSGGSGIGKTAQDLQNSAPGAFVRKGSVLNHATTSQIKEFIEANLA